MDAFDALTLEEEIQFLQQRFRKSRSNQYFTIRYALDEIRGELSCIFTCNDRIPHKIFAQIPENYPSDPPFWYTRDEDIRTSSAVTRVSCMTTNEIYKNVLIYQVHALVKELCTQYGITDYNLNDVESTFLVGNKSSVKHDVKSPVAALANIGNTCFLNSVLYTLRFAPSFLHKLHHLSLEGDAAASRETIISGLHDLYAALYHNERKVHMETYRPHKLLQLIRERNADYNGDHEHDAQEFFSFLLDTIQEVNTPSGNNAQKFLENKLSLCEDFRGETLIKTVCQECENHSEQKENNFPFILHISIRRVENEDEDPDDTYLAALFKSLIMTQEYFDGEYKISCEVCLRKNEAKHVYEYEKLPRLLTLHMTRFYAFKRQMEKMKDYMPTPLTLPCYCTECQNTSSNIKSPHRYALYGIIVHIGETLHTGHYKCFVRRLKSLRAECEESAPVKGHCNFSKCCTVTLQNEPTASDGNEEDLWLECNDSEITTLSTEKLTNLLLPHSNGGSMTPYLLFYAKIDA